MPDREVIQLNFPTSAIFSSLPRMAVEAISSRLPFSDDEVEEVKIAVGEACSNAIKYSEGMDDNVTVLYRITDDSLEIEIRNAGRPFNPPNVIPTDPTAPEMREGGLGLHMIQKLTDELHIECASGMNAVKMIKHFKPDTHCA